MSSHLQREVTLGLVLAHKLHTASGCVPLNLGEKESESAALEGGAAQWGAPASSANAHTPSFRPGCEKTESELGTEQTRVQICLCHLLAL